MSDIQSHRKPKIVMFFPKQQSQSVKVQHKTKYRITIHYLVGERVANVRGSLNHSESDRHDDEPEPAVSLVL